MPNPTRLDPADLDQVVGGVAINGGGGADRLVGTAGTDLIMGNGGADAIAGGGGADQIDGGAGADVLQGDGGNDVLDGGQGDRAADQAFGGEGNDTYVWSPGSGSDSFRGMAGQDTLLLRNMTVDDLRGALQVSQTGLQMQVNGNFVTFTNAQGQPATFGGTINVGGERLSFSEVERIQVR